MSRSASERIRGRCLCGAVALALRPPTDFCAHCHCESCRRSHAAALVTWTSVPLERFELTKGEAAIRWYGSSATIEWGFCGTCGTSMLYRATAEGHPEGPRVGHMYVAVGCLVDPLDRAPAVHVSYEERVAWLRVADDLPKHRGKTSEVMGEDER